MNINVLFGALTFLLVATFIPVMAWSYRHVRNGKWHTYGHKKMRRFINGRWQVRDALDGENDDDIFNYLI